MATRHMSWFLYTILAILVSLGNAAEQQPLQAVDATPKKVAIIGRYPFQLFQAQN